MTFKPKYLNSPEDLNFQQGFGCPLIFHRRSRASPTGLVPSSAVEGYMGYAIAILSGWH